MASQIERITAERVRAELDKLILGEYPIDGMNVMCETGLADYVLPEVPQMKLEIDEHHQHKDVYWHSLTVLKQAVDLEEGDPDLVLRWAALLHDIGKPDTKRNEPGGGVSFHHHEVVGAKMVRKRMRALKYSKQMVDDVSQLVFLHLRFHGYGKGQWTDSAVRRYVTDAGRPAAAPAQAGPRRLHHAQQAAGGRSAGDVRRHRGADRPDRRAGRPRAGAPRPRRQRHHGVARHSGRPGRREGLEVPQGAAARSRSPQPGRGRGRTAVVVGRAEGLTPPSVVLRT